LAFASSSAKEPTFGQNLGVRYRSAKEPTFGRTLAFAIARLKNQHLAEPWRSLPARLKNQHLGRTLAFATNSAKEPTLGRTLAFASSSANGLFLAHKAHRKKKKTTISGSLFLFGGNNKNLLSAEPWRSLSARLKNQHLGRTLAFATLG
jgi:hypothetical protein